MQATLRSEPLGLGAFLLRRITGRKRTEDPYRQLLLLRMAAVNLAAAALLATAWQQGWVARLLEADGSRIVWAITALFLLGLAASLRRGREIAYELDQARAPRPDPGSRAGRFLAHVRSLPTARRPGLEAVLELELAAMIAPLRHVASTLVLLGLIGTVIGFLVALSGVDADGAADLSRVAPMVARLIEGLGIALYTTLAGSVLHLWLMANVRLLEGGAARLAAALLRRGAGCGGRA